jgi:hypothetical protein
VIVRTVTLLTNFILGSTALQCLVALWMILKLLPSVAGATPVLKLAAVLVGLCILFGLPAGALCALILIDVGWPSEVLPVMRVNACITLMLLVRKGTPNSLEVEQVKIDVALKVLEHVYRQL